MSGSIMVERWFSMRMYCPHIDDLEQYIAYLHEMVLSFRCEIADPLEYPWVEYVTWMEELVGRHPLLANVLLPVDQKVRLLNE